MLDVNHLYCRYFYSDNPLPEQAARELLAAYEPEGIPVRMVCFGNPADNTVYRQELEIIQSCVKDRFGDCSPVISYVAQMPVDGNRYLLEVHEIAPDKTNSIAYKTEGTTPYISVTKSDMQTLYIGGVLAPDLDAPVALQSEYLFQTIGRILDRESMPISAIVRQWNYIESITGIENGRQRYQDFNDARSLFYNQTEWPQGYPAATGIGTTAGGIMVELQAQRSLKGDVCDYPVDNRLQIAAHNYSQQVLIGERKEEFPQKTTPKFERAKLVMQGACGDLFISGTAAIRGELSAATMNLTQQTELTLDNIKQLISAEALIDGGFRAQHDCRIQAFRVYLKSPEGYTEAEKVISTQYPDVAAIYVLADVCRDELLIEIEGLAIY